MGVYTSEAEKTERERGAFFLPLTKMGGGIIHMENRKTADTSRYRYKKKSGGKGERERGKSVSN